MVLKQIFLKNLFTAYITTKDLALVKLKLANAQIITKCDDINVTERHLTKNSHIVRYIERNQFLEIRCPL